MIMMLEQTFVSIFRQFHRDVQPHYNMCELCLKRVSKEKAAEHRASCPLTPEGATLMAEMAEPFAVRCVKCGRRFKQWKALPEYVSKKVLKSFVKIKVHIFCSF